MIWVTHPQKAILDDPLVEMRAAENYSLILAKFYLLKSSKFKFTFLSSKAESARSFTKILKFSLILAWSCSSLFSKS